MFQGVRPAAIPPPLPVIIIPNGQLEERSVATAEPLANHRALEISGSPDSEAIECDESIVYHSGSSWRCLYRADEKTLADLSGNVRSRP